MNFKSSNHVVSVPSKLKRGKIQFLKPAFVRNFTKPVNKLRNPFWTISLLLAIYRGRVPARTENLKYGEQRTYPARRLGYRNRIKSSLYLCSIVYHRNRNRNLQIGCFFKELNPCSAEHKIGTGVPHSVVPPEWHIATQPGRDDPSKEPECHLANP